MPSRNKSRWESTAMPWIAEAIAAAEATYQATLDNARADIAAHPSRPYMAQMVKRLPDADLYWMSRTAATVAMDMAGSLPAVTFRELIATSELPAAGLMIWPKSLAALPWDNNRVSDPHAPTMETTTWDGIAWFYDDEAFTSFLISRVEALRAAGALSVDRPRWSPAQSVRLDSVPLDSCPGGRVSLMPTAPPIPDMGAVSPMVGQVVTALLALIGQQRILTTRSMPSQRPTTFGRSAGDRTVVLLDVLRPPTSGRSNSQRDEQALRRWFVRGHWRKQPHGPGGQLRKWIYVDLHTAGHADAPEPSGRPAPRVNAVYGQRTQPAPPS